MNYLTNLVQFPGLGLSFQLNRVAFTIGGVSIYWYGVCIAVGLCLALVFAFRHSLEFGVDPDSMVDVILIGVVLGIVSARAYYVAMAPFKYQSIWEMIDIRKGGIAIYGAVLGAFIFGGLAAKWRKVPLLPLFDLVSLGFLIGQGIGRWGNFFNQEAFGTNTDTALFRMWSVKIRDTLAASSADLAAKGVTVDPEVPVHPTFLYESLWCVLGFLILNYIVHKHRSFKGEIFVLYGVWYGVERMVVEGMRTDSLYIGSTSIRVSQVLSAVIAVVALVYFIVVMVKKKQGRLPQRLRVVPVEELPPRPTKEERRAAQAAKRSKTKNKGVNEEKNGTDH
mgnify:CR=1 FL=1